MKRSPRLRTEIVIERNEESRESKFDMNEGALHVSADSKRQSNSAEGISDRLAECLHLVYYCRSHFSESDLPPTDDEDETLDTKSGPFSPENGRGRFRSFSCSANYSTPRNNSAKEKTGNLRLEEKQVDEKKNHEELQILGKAATRNKPNNLDPNPIRPSIALDLLPSDDEDEVFDDETVCFPAGETEQGRFEMEVSSPVSLLQRPCSHLQNDKALSGAHGEENYRGKLKANGVQGAGEHLENMLLMPAIPRRARANSTDREKIRENLHPKLRKRRSSESDITQGNEMTSRDHTSQGRTRAGSCHIPSSFGDYFIRRSRGKLTENASKLSAEEIHSLELDIFKPIDFYEILFERMQVKGAKTAA